ncbi:PQQ-dependent dehydrogenase, methanol/ethanol family [Zavarzinia sp. CC-PAN008]|uniref:PQQ-dependent dehydrogenase, methanol/ethanol family n=1 Tax=Zavarzinia sp. CC-PAN008 TaxID=3243332 RepID=UPI003F744719
MNWRNGILALGAVLSLSSLTLAPASLRAADLHDGADGADWPAFGRTYGEQHYSPLDQVNAQTVSRLGLSWFMDLGAGNPATIPVAVDGILYFASGLSVVHAVEAQSGRLLWTYDPEVGAVAGHKMRQGWGSRGIGYWNGKVYTGSADGRLIAIDVKTGKPVWSVMTVDPKDGRYITGAPRLFDGKVIIGHGGGDSADIRGYVTTYDAETGAQLWRFFTVPGNPADGFEDATQEMAAKTWGGEWWKHGGGGNVWNAITYDAETDTVFLGTGNGAPWNRRIRSADIGDNLFLCSIVALDAKTGAYKWHYQVNPGETWDYNAAMTMNLADITIDGRVRKVLMQAPKNGFLYVLDRVTGELLRADRIAKVTWATGIDMATGRPMEVPEARYPGGKDFALWPGANGAHSWMPSAWSPKAGLLYIPTMEQGLTYNDKDITGQSWHRRAGNAYDFAINVGMEIKDPLQNTGWLLAIDPATGEQRWKVQNAAYWNGGVLATGGDLVFQGQTNGILTAYEAATGKPLWTFDAQVPIIAAPITYSVGGTQYLTILVGMGTSGTMMSRDIPIPVDSRNQAKRVLTFALDGKGALPPPRPVELIAAEDPDFHSDPAAEALGAVTYAYQCVVCHGMEAISGGAAPDLRTSPIVPSAELFGEVVRDGSLARSGMPGFDHYSDAELEALRQYIRARANDLRSGQ